MICKFSVENFKAFAEKVELSFIANRNIKRLDFNYFTESGKPILKTCGIYGPNNTGKTCLLEALLCLKNLMLNGARENCANVFADVGTVTSFDVEYCVNGRLYEYKFDYDNSTNDFIKESLILREYHDGDYVNSSIFVREKNKITWNGIASALKNNNIIKLFSLKIPFMSLFDDKDNKVMNQAKLDYLDFAHSLSFFKMDRPVSISKTISLMQNDEKARKFIKEFVKNCDLHIDDFGFSENVKSDANIENQLKVALNDPFFAKESLKFYSKHNGYVVPSVFFDSVGTLKLIALSGYIYDALSKGKVLMIDEIDNSLHHILTKAIVAMFNNDLNKKAQLIFTTHDALLLDLKSLFRKDQIWLVDINNSLSSKITRLSEFTSRSDNGIRGDEDVVEYYLRGQFGSIPTPDLFDALLEAVSDE